MLMLVLPRFNAEAYDLQLSLSSLLRHIVKDQCLFVLRVAQVSIGV